MVGAVVAEQCPQDVDPAAGEGQDGLVVFLALGSLAVVEAPRFGTGPDADHRGVVEGIVDRHQHRWKRVKQIDRDLTGYRQKVSS